MTVRIWKGRSTNLWMWVCPSCSRGWRHDTHAEALDRVLGHIRSIHPKKGW